LALRWQRIDSFPLRAPPLLAELPGLFQNGEMTNRYLRHAPSIFMLIWALAQEQANPFPAER
jgi:hypothetical protein